MSTSPHQPQRRPDTRTSPYAPLRDHYDATILKICKPHHCTTETQRQTETFSRFAEDQRLHFGRLHQQQPPH